MKKIFICLILSIFILTGCSADSTNTINETDECTDGCEITNIEESDISTTDISLDVISFNDALSYALNDETTGLFMLSFVDCPWCKVVLPLVEEMAQQHPDIKTYYVDVTRDERVEGQSTYDRYYELVKPFLDEHGYEKIYIPAFVFIKDGEIVKYHTGVVGDALELNDEEKDIFRATITSGYELIKGDQ